MKMRMFVPLVLAALISLVFSACATTSPSGYNSDVPLPLDLKIVPPNSSVPAEYTGFSGKWEGRWDNTLNHILVVEEIKGSNAVVVVYAWGRAPSWFIDPGWGRAKGQFKDNELILNLPNGAVVTYRLNNGVLASEYDRGRYFARATMKRSG